MMIRQALLLLFSLLLSLGVLFPLSSGALLYLRDMTNIPPNYEFYNTPPPYNYPNPSTMSTPPATSICPDSTYTTFAISLVQQNLDVLEELFWNVSNPTHRMYRKYQTPTYIWSLIGPSATCVSNIGHWLVNAGIPVSDIHFYGDVMEVYTTCGIANTLFNTTLYMYMNNVTQQTTISQFGPSYIPDQFTSSIHMIVGIQTFPIPSQHNYVYSDKTTSLKDWAPNDRDTQERTPTHVMSLRSFNAAFSSSAGRGLSDEEADFDENATPFFNSSSSSSHRFHTMSPPTSAVVIGPSLLAAYGLPDRTQWYPPHGFTSSVSVGVVEFLSTGPQSYNPTDLRHFADYSGYAYPFQLSSKHVVGNNVKKKPGLEATVDIQSVSTINPQAAAWFWLMPSTTWMYSWAYQFYSQIEAGLPYPQVVSISYTSSDEYFNCGVPGSTDCQVYGINPADTGDSYSYESRTNTLFQMIGLSGVTILVSSGDDGANGVYGYSGSGVSQQCSYTETTLEFIPEWPTTSPYVTSVGATDFMNSEYGAPIYSNGYNSKAQLCGEYTVNGPPPFNFHCVIGNIHEQAVSIKYDGFTSGGGFSTIYSQPWYQTNAVNGWVATNPYMPSYPRNTTSYLFNINARAFPDVSAYGGAQWLVLFKSQFRYIGGTSLSTPVFAGVVTLLNEIALQYGNKKPLGFINPLLYQMASDTAGTSTPCFNDITVGNNKSPRNPAAGFTCDGFNCAVGWDPVTGLGTPNFPNMKAYLLNLFTTGNGLPSQSGSGGGNINSTATGVSGNQGVNPNAPPNGGIVGDPQFNGFNGASFQIHGVSGAIYNIISTNIFQFNVEFSFLNEGFCSAQLLKRTMCWTHPGNYLGTVALMSRDSQTGNETILVVRSGAHDEGMMVFVNDGVLPISSQPVRFPHPKSKSPMIIKHADKYTLTVQTDEFIVQLDNSHYFLNQQVAMQSSLSRRIKAMKAVAQQQKRSLNASEIASLPHGLLGQTWSDKKYNNQWKYIKGDIADYQLSDGLLGHQFQYNQYQFNVEREQQRLAELAELVKGRGEAMQIDGQFNALIPGHTHNEEEESVGWGEVPDDQTEDEILGEAAENGDVNEYGLPLGKPLILLPDPDLPLPDVVAGKPVLNKLNQMLNLDGVDSSDLVWSSVHPESVEGLDGALSDDRPKKHKRQLKGHS